MQFLQKEDKQAIAKMTAKGPTEADQEVYRGP